MSLLNKASLIQIPSGYKDGTLYSAKPTNGDGDFTFSRGSNLAATRVNSEGLIEKGRENLFFASDTSDSAAGRATRGSSTTIKGVSGYFYSDSGAGNPNINKSVAGYSTGFATFSIYVDTTNANSIKLNFAKDGNASNGTQATFNATTKTWGSIIENGTYVSSGSTQLSFEDLGDNVFRLSIGANFTASGSTHFPVVYFGTGNTNVAIGGAQVEKGLVATDYIETTTTTEQAGILEDMPRLDYSGGATCPSLLLEPQRTNVLPHSEYFDASDWTKTNGTVSISNEISPEGKLNAYKFTESTGTINPSIRQNLGASTTTDVTLSVFAKPNGRDYLYLALTGSDAIIFDISNGTIGTTLGTIDSYAITDMGNGWYRCSATKSTNQRDANFGPKATNAFGTYTGDGTSGIYFYGAMVEEGSYPTSYIPTYGAISTRSEDTCSKTGISSLIGQTEGTLFIELDNADELDVPEITLDDGTNNNRIVLTRSFTGYWSLFTASAGSGSSTSSAVISNNGKFAIAYNATNYVVYKDGALLLTRTASLPVSLTDFRLNGRVTNDFYGNKSIKQALLFKTRLTNAELADLTTL